MRSKEKLHLSIIKEYEDQNLLLGKILHEYIVQDLYAIQITLNRYSIEQGHSLPIDQVKHILDGTITKVQQMANDLLPVVLRDFGFQRAVKDLFLNYNGIKNDIIIDKAVETLGFNAQLRLFQMLQLLLSAMFLTEDQRILIIRLIVNKEELKLEMEGVDDRYIEKIKHDNKNKLEKLKEKINLLEGTLNISTGSDRNTIDVTVKLD